ncbi:MAG: hypothetical protein HYU64_05515 [Armatimonadetes bacterium]|nr:hypothetical protein [Armatimonadota bacterium]
MMLESSRFATVLICLPMFYNPDEHGKRKPVEDENFVQTAEEISKKFGGGTLFVFKTDSPRGFWWDRGIVCEDVHALLEVDVPHTTDSQAWLKKYARDVLIKRFRQKAIHMKYIGPVGTIEVRDETVAETSDHSEL